jgi:hypothetical protein
MSQLSSKATIKKVIARVLTKTKKGCVLQNAKAAVAEKKGFEGILDIKKYIFLFSNYSLRVIKLKLN